MTGVEIAAAAAVAASAVAAYSSVQAGQAQNKMAKYNAQVAEQQAKAQRDAAAYQADRAREQAAKNRSAQRVAAAASGVTPEGSPLELLGDTAAMDEMNALVIKYNGEVGASQSESRATLDRMQGRQAVTSSYLSAGSSLLSGASKASQIYSTAPTTTTTTPQTGKTP